MKGKYAILALFIVGLVFVSGCIGGGEEIKEKVKEEAESAVQSYTESYTSTEEYEESETYTETESESATWVSPWDAYRPIEIDGQKYMITYIKYHLRVRTEEGGDIYEYKVEKKREKTKIHIYGNKVNMETGEQEKVDLGEFEVYEYYGKITPINSADMEAPLEYTVWVKERTENTDTFFLFPSLDFFALYASLYGGGDVIGISITYGDQRFIFYNPGAVGDMSTMPYQEGDMDLISNIPDIGNIYTSWYGFYTFGIWTAIEGEDLYKAKKGSWGFMGYQYNYEIDPDGTVNLGGKGFKVSTVRWTYTLGNIQGQGEATLSANLPIPIEAKGVFIEQNGANIFTHVKIEDIRFEKV
ncbi:hypothetical protein PAP_09305 [Palaeococcus pacificus DY20341]|uniref:Uncharacterized protein n=1 Tax=Palaeococcus pacificus DY20341 TaxID=1343739 RepID=A0A075LV80_9EURY|nr:hypothetical protein [Palaeococcus pacificus]AIF70239.1 hypothetical protein PAP_09305 [Palaeococcus pacificus DY20341]